MSMMETYDQFYDSMDHENDQENDHCFQQFNGSSAFTVKLSPFKQDYLTYESAIENETFPVQFKHVDFMDDDDHPKFKLPPRLAARLYKNQTSNKVLQNLENVESNTVNENAIPIIRRETIVVRSKKTKQNLLNQAHNLVLNHENNVISKTVATENEVEDSHYVNWINSVIATSFKIENITVDTARIINDCIMSETTNVKNKSNTNSNSYVPLKDGITTIAYREEKLMNMLIDKAHKLYNEDSDMKLVREVLLEDIRVPRYYIRKDRSIHADVGSKKHILEILLNYNPLWLKVALETIFGQKINRNGKNEVHTLVQFLTQNLLSFKSMALKHKCKNVTTYFMNENNVKMAKQHILYHFLMIVHFLDVAKRKRLIDHDPCLFRMEAESKSSRDIVLAFSRDYITGVGDITKSLRNVGIHLNYVQNSIEEFNFTVTKLSGDLRCGVRLARLSEIILLRNDILPRLYFPPNNITRKIHNMELLFQIWKPLLGESFEKSFNPKDICIGNRIKTILLLDRLIEVYNIRQREIEFQQSIDRIILIQKTFRRYIQCREERQRFLKLRNAAISLQQIYRSMKETRMIRNEFLKKKLASVIIQKNWRAYHQQKLYNKLRESTIVLQQRFRAHLEMKRCKREYQLMKKSSITIQRAYRSFVTTRQQRNEFLKMKLAAIMIQKKLRGFHQRKRYLKMKEAAIILQQRFRAQMKMKQCQRKYQLMRQNAIIIQRAYRSSVLTRQYRNEYLKMKAAAIMVQKVWRGYIQRKAFLELKKRTIAIQQRFRANRQKKQCRKDYQTMRQSAIIIQRFYRSSVLTRQYQKEFLKMKLSSIMIEKVWRGFQQRKRYLKMKESAIVLQRRFRAQMEMKRCRNQYQLMRQSSITIQRTYRSFVLTRQHRAEFLKIKSSAILIEKVWRGYHQRKLYQKMKGSSIVIQRRFRAQIEMKRCQREYQKIRQNAITIQRAYRSFVLTRNYRNEFLKMKSAAILIQKVWRSQVQRKSYEQLKKSTIVMQRRFRAQRMMKQQCDNYQQLKQATIFVQKRFRQNKQFRIDHERYQSMKKAAIVIQSVFKGQQQRRSYLQLRQAVIYIQTRFRTNMEARIQRENYLKLRNGVIMIQRRWRLKLHLIKRTNAAIVIQQRFRAQREMQKCRREYQQYRQAILVIQSRFRALMIGRQERKQYLQKKNAAIKIQRFCRNIKRGNHFKNVVQLYVTKIKQSTLIIQKHYRGFVARKKFDVIYPSLIFTRKRLEIANKNVTENKKLINVILAIIYRMSRAQSVDHLFTDIDKIEKGTTWSIEICQIIVENQRIIEKLLCAFEALNRSEPHKKIIFHILGIFIQILSKTESKFLYSNVQVLDTLIKLIKIFPKSDNILVRVVEILTFLLEDPRTIKKFKSNKHWYLTLESFLSKNVPKCSLANKNNLRRYSVSVTNLLPSGSYQNGPKVKSLQSMASKLYRIIN